METRSFLLVPAFEPVESLRLHSQTGDPLNLKRNPAISRCGFFSRSEPIRSVDDYCWLLETYSLFWSGHLRCHCFVPVLECETRFWARKAQNPQLKKYLSHPVIRWFFFFFGRENCVCAQFLCDGWWKIFVVTFCKFCNETEPVASQQSQPQVLGVLSKWLKITHWCEFRHWVTVLYGNKVSNLANIGPSHAAIGCIATDIKLRGWKC